MSRLLVNFELKDIIALWGALISTLLAVDKLKQMLRRLDLRSYWDPETNLLKSEVTNVSARPVTVTRVELAYGYTPKDATTISTLSASDIALHDGQLVRFQVQREALAEAREKIGAVLLPHSLLWLRARLAGFGHAHTAVAIDPQAIGAVSVDPLAAPYIAAGLLLGFSSQQLNQLNRASFGEIYTK